MRHNELMGTKASTVAASHLPYLLCYHLETKASLLYSPTQHAPFAYKSAKQLIVYVVIMLKYLSPYDLSETFILNKLSLHDDVSDPMLLQIQLVNYYHKRTSSSNYTSCHISCSATIAN